jgi:hypothetical protein
MEDFLQSLDTQKTKDHIAQELRKELQKAGNILKNLESKGDKDSYEKALSEYRDVQEDFKEYIENDKKITSDELEDLM